MTAESETRSTHEAGPVIALLVVSAFVVILNETIMSVALPRLMQDLNITASSAQWLTTAFMLTMAVVIPATGFLLQRFAIRTVFFSAMGLFTLGTVVAASAPGFSVLLVGRMLQACGTAIMMPLLMTTVLTLVPANRRGRTMGVISIVISVAPAVGPTVSGLILSVLDWRWMFIVMLPIALTAIGLGAIWVKNVTEPRSTPFDVFSLVLSAFAFGGLIFGLSSIGEAAEGNALMPVWIPLVVGALALVWFVLRQLSLHQEDRALLDLRTFRSRHFTVAMLIVAISTSALFGVLILLPIYLQQVRGLDVLSTGLLLLPGGIVMAVMAPIVGRTFDRVGPRPLVIPGTVIFCIALWWMIALGASTSFVAIVSMHLVMSAGLALMFTPLLTSALGSLEPALYSHGSAIVGTAQQLAGAAGTALFVATMSVATTAAEQGGQSVDAAATAGVHAAFLWGAGLGVVTVLLSFLVRRPPQVSDPSPDVRTDSTGEAYAVGQ